MKLLLFHFHDKIKQNSPFLNVPLSGFVVSAFVNALCSSVSSSVLQCIVHFGIWLVHFSIPTRAVAVGNCKILFDASVWVCQTKFLAWPNCDNLFNTVSTRFHRHSLNLINRTCAEKKLLSHLPTALSLSLALLHLPLFTLRKTLVFPQFLSNILVSLSFVSGRAPIPN